MFLKDENSRTKTDGRGGKRRRGFKSGNWRIFAVITFSCREGLDKNVTKAYNKGEFLKRRKKICLR